MSSEPVPVTINILDKEYMVSCPPEERDALVEAAQMLSSRMRQVRDSGKVLGTERMAVMTALNVIHELTRQNHVRERHLADTGEELRRLEQKVVKATPRRAVREPVD